MHFSDNIKQRMLEKTEAPFGLKWGFRKQFKMSKNLYFTGKNLLCERG